MSQGNKTKQANNVTKTPGITDLKENEKTDKSLFYFNCPIISLIILFHILIKYPPNISLKTQ